MNLDLKKFVKYIVFIGIIYGAIKLTNNQFNLNKQQMLQLLVVSLVLMVTVDNMLMKETFADTKKDEKADLLESADKLDDINLSYDVKTNSEDNSVELIKVDDKDDKEPLIKLSETEEEDDTSTESVKKAVEVKEPMEMEQTVDCSVEVAKMKRKLETEVKSIREELMLTRERMNRNSQTKNYMNMLVKTLITNGILDRIDVDNINAKLTSKVSSVPEVIESLEKLLKTAKPKLTKSKKGSAKYEDENEANAMKYSERPTQYYEPIGKGVSNWSNEYTILNTDKWSVPMTRPPVCISNGNCKVCPSNTEGYPVSLKEWHSSSKVTDMTINKKWASDQKDSQSPEEFIKVDISKK